MEKIQILRRTAAQVLGTALFEMFPNCTIKESFQTDTGFGCDFTLTESLNAKKSQEEGLQEERFLEDKLWAIEEKMVLMVAEQREIKNFQTTFKNALDYFKHCKMKNSDLFFQQKKDLELINIIQINNFFHWVEEEDPFLNNTKDLKYFKLYKIEKNKKIYRIFGALFEEEKELKKYLKEQKEYLENNHLNIGKELNLFFPLDENKYSSQWIWTKKGIILQEIILDFFKKELEDQGFYQIKTAQDKKRSLQALCSNQDIPFKGYEMDQEMIENSDKRSFGLFQESKNLILTEYLTCLEKDVLPELISSLNFFLKILKILGFDNKAISCKVFFGEKKQKFFEEALRTCKITSFQEKKKNRLKKEASIEFFLEDGQKWFHKGPSLSLDLLSNNYFMIKRSTMGLIEPLIALILEKHKGFLPFWLNPEKVRLLVLDKDHLKYAEKVKSLCKKNQVKAYIDNDLNSLNEKIYKAIKEKVFFIGVIGKKEQNNNSITIRQMGKIEKEQMTIDSFLEKLQDIQKQW